MSLPFLVYCSLLKRAQYKNWCDLAAVNSDAVDMAAVDQAIRETVEKRLSLAQDFLVFSEGLVSPAGAVSDMANRNAVSRAYYAVHHAIRALLMFVENGDVDGHRESIKAICDLLKRNPALRSKLGEVEDFRTEILEMLNQRHLADYYPYGTNATNEGPLDFGQAAQEAVQFARRVVEKTREFIELKEAGVF